MYLFGSLLIRNLETIQNSSKIILKCSVKNFYQNNCNRFNSSTSLIIMQIRNPYKGTWRYNTWRRFDNTKITFCLQVNINLYMALRG